MVAWPVSFRITGWRSAVNLAVNSSTLVLDTKVRISNGFVAPRVSISPDLIRAINWWRPTPRCFAASW